MLRKIFVLLLVVSAINIFTPIAQMKTEDQKISESFGKETNVKEYKFSIPSGKKARLTFKTIVNDGSVRLRLLDPEKNPRFGMRISADKNIAGRGQGFSDDLDFMTGDWSVVVNADEATGKYEIIWEVVDSK